MEHLIQPIDTTNYPVKIGGKVVEAQPIVPKGIK